MILIAFPHYTCGGLLCDIINNVSSNIGANGGLDNSSHSLLKVGDADTVQTSVDLVQFEKQFKNNKHLKVAGTHCSPNALPCEWFEKVINITTQTYKSKVYRWARAYYLYYINSEPWQLSGQQLVDKGRETAKLYLEPNLMCNRDNVVNIEFEDIVESTQRFQQEMQGYNFQLHLDHWKNNNQFLYAKDFYTSKPLQLFAQAEYETLTGQYYVYQ